MIKGIISFIERLAVADVAFTVALVLVVSLFLCIQLRKSNPAVSLRRIAGFERIKELVDVAVESGRPIHLSLGKGAANTPGAVDSIVGLSMVDYINARTAGFQGCDVTCGDATLFTSIPDRIREDESGFAGATRHTDGIYFCGPDPLVYANGAVQHLGWSLSQANLFMGYAGTECLYIAGPLAGRQIQQAGGASSPLSAALLHTTIGDTIVGEEFYATRAYLHHPADIKSVIIQDWLRYLILLAVIVGVALASIGYGR
ncbi:MAG: DUF6754 domain-containing protein [Anaerolineae bacterium]